MTTVVSDPRPTMGHPVCWKGVLAGAVAAVGVSLILLVLGSGLGLATGSPWTFSLASFSAKIAIWLIVMQWASAAIGGYLAGRLRPAPRLVHDDEVYFRDTAQGFLTWCVATLIVAMFLGSATTAAVSGGVQSATVIAAGAAAGAVANGPADPHGGPAEMLAYDVDTMFRGPADGSLPPADPASRMEAARIIANAVANDGALAPQDRDYLAQGVAKRTGVSVEEAGARVDRVIADLGEKKQDAMQAAEKARKVSATVSIFTALSLLLGAFIACVAGVIGGRHRTYYPAPVA